MKREQKLAEIEVLKAKFSESPSFYITDASSMTVAQVNDFRRVCHEKGIYYKVAKNTLVKKALDACDADFKEELYEIFKGPSSIMFTEVGNVPAKILKEFRENNERPILKAAYIDADLYVGDEQIEILSKLKSKEELVGEIIGLLQSPAKNVISALQSGGNKLSGIIKTLGDREEK